jgi:hypothetical protein
MVQQLETRQSRLVYDPAEHEERTCPLPLQMPYGMARAPEEYRLDTLCDPPAVHIFERERTDLDGFHDLSAFFRLIIFSLQNVCSQRGILHPLLVNLC